MSQGDSRVGRRGRACRDSWDDLEGDAGPSQDFGLLTAAAEDEGVSSLEAGHRFALAGSLEEQGIDLRLRNMVPPPCLPT